MHKIVGCACAANAEKVFPLSRVSDRDLHAGMHAGITNKRNPLKSVAGKTSPAFPVHAQPAILRIW